MKHRRITRRELLGRTAALGAGAFLALRAPLGAISPGAFAAPLRRGKTKTIVAVFLRGGADGLNMVVPYKDPLYREVRPRIGIPEKDEEGKKGVIVLDERFGLHPGLVAFKELFEKKMFAPVVCVGSPHPTRSHFDAQDFMEYASPGMKTLKDGWLNRYLTATRRQDAASSLRGIALQRLLPRSVRGEFPVLAAPEDTSDVKSVLNTFDDVYDVGGMQPMGEGMAEVGQDASVEVGRETIETLRRLYDILDKKSNPAADTAGYPRSGFAKQLRRISQVIKADAGLEVATVDIGGWDHHINEGGSSGDFFRKTSDFSSSIAAFSRDLGDRFEDVLVIVMTEFGRTVAENGNEGTDHGHGSVMLLASGALAGGKVFGKWQGLDPKFLYEGRDLTATTDYRTVFDETLLSFMRFDAPKDFFPKYDRVKPLGLFA